jgi:Arc/MetJ-type ribon-helix-helix transcriptional regulator
MKIITVNLPITFLKIIEGYVGEGNLYPSRSELFRVAIREFLIKELNDVENQQLLEAKNLQKKAIIPDLDLDAIIINNTRSEVMKKVIKKDLEKTNKNISSINKITINTQTSKSGGEWD